MIKIEYETADFLPHEIEVTENEALNMIIKITSEGGHVHWVERV